MGCNYKYLRFVIFVLIKINSVEGLILYQGNWCVRLGNYIKIEFFVVVQFIGIYGGVLGMVVLANVNYFVVSYSFNQKGWLVVVMILEYVFFKLELSYDSWGMGVFIYKMFI